MSNEHSSATGCLSLLAGFFFKHRCPRCGQKFRRGGVTEWVKREGHPPVCRKCYGELTRQIAP